ncbi:MAG: hypothetical protein ABIZ81_17535 [Opitutaceae bacterium]
MKGDLRRRLPFDDGCFPGHTADKTTLRGMLDHLRRRYGAAERIRVMDRGIPTEDILVRRTEPSRDVALRPALALPPRPPSKIRSPRTAA